MDYRALRTLVNGTLDRAEGNEQFEEGETFGDIIIVVETKREALDGDGFETAPTILSTTKNPYTQRGLLGEAADTATLKAEEEA